jgi:hypothetical protein
VRARGGRTRPGPSGRLLERERELEALAAAVGAAAEGTSGLVLVEGPAGRCCVAATRGTLKPWPPPDQMAKASSSNATATRRFAGSSAASS